MSEYYSAITYLAVIIMFIMIAIVAECNYLAKDTKIGYIFTFGMIAIAAISEFLGVYLDGNSQNTRILHYFVKYLEFSISPFIALICAIEVFEIAEREKKIMSIILIVHSIVEFISMFEGWIFYIDDNNMYHHGDYCYIYIIVSLGAIVTLLMLAYRFSRKYQNQNGYILFCILAFVASGITIQIINSNIRIDWITISISSIFIYIYHNGLMQYVDGLTQLLNQRSFLADTANLRKSGIIIMFDIDDFKSINDQYGHQYGNDCIVEVAKLIKKCYRDYGLCYRTGGDEFAVVLNGDCNIIDDLNIQFESEQKKIKLQENRFPTISFGYSIFNPEYDLITDIVKNADKNMYKAKNEKKQKIIR